MLPHVPTLTLATLAVSSILALLLFFTWLQGRNERALLYWGAAGLTGAIGLVLLVGDRNLLPFGSATTANALFIVCAGLTWCGARVFGGRRPCAGWVALAVVLWVTAVQVTFVAETLAVRVGLNAGLRAAFIVLAMLELWRGRGERLLSRWPAIFALGIHATALMARIPVVGFFDLPPEPEIFQTGWFGATALGQLLYTTAITFILLAMTKERAELRHKVAALTDSLTGLLNRRAFMEEGAETLVRAASAPMPAAALVFDLDAFKSINDRFGHAAGDRVLQRFAATLRDELRGTDVMGRLGGEEFAALLPGCTMHQAAGTAERIRTTFAAAACIAGGEAITATVSVGVAVAAGGTDEDLDTLLAEADRAVYLAKRAGRNCVHIAGVASATAEPAEIKVAAPSLAA